MKTVNAWAVKNNEGHILSFSVAGDKIRAEARFCSEYTVSRNAWKLLLNSGYKVVQVEIKEVSDDS